MSNSMMDLLAVVAKVAGLSSAGIFAGYTWGMSRFGMESILNHGPSSESVILPKWRLQYVDGSQFSRPCCLVSLVSFGFLAYQAPPSSILRTLYTIAAVLNSSGVPYALTFLRRTNGALSIRSKSALGPFSGSNGQPIALTYANNDRGSIEREKSPAWTTRRLIERWIWHNNIRSVALVLGTVIGASAVVLSDLV